MKKTERIYIRLDKEMLRRLNKLAKQNKMSVSSFMRFMITNFWLIGKL